MKKRITKIIALLLLLAIICSVFTTQVFALSAESVIEFQNTSMKDGKFSMPVRICVSGTASANLVDSKNNVIENYKTLNVVFGTVITYTHSFAKNKSGDYYLNVKFAYPQPNSSGDGFSRRLKITHKQASPKIAFTKTYQAYTDAGDAKQVFKFDYYNANGKQMNFEVYDLDGKFVTKSSVVVKHDNGNCIFNWNYYPQKGGIMVSSGTYILKYWVQGQTPKQIEFDVDIGEG